MAIKIFKYPLQLTDYQEIEIPSPAVVLSVVDQYGTLCLYAMVETDEEVSLDEYDMIYKKVPVLIRGTGHDLKDAYYARFMASIPMHNGLVWHVFIDEYGRV